MPKPKEQLKRISNTIKRHKLVIFLSILVLIFPATYGYNAYKDWDNAQMIKGLAKDFPALVAEIEQATGLDLEIKTDCSITQEKYSAGVKTCEFRASKKAGEESVKKGEQVILNSNKLGSVYIRENEIAYTVEYRKKATCTYALSESVSFVCITAVNEANIDLAKELFLNQQ